MARDGRGCGLKNKDLFVFSGTEPMSNFMVRRWRQASEEAIERKGLFIAALSGGKTPVHFYRTLANQRGTLPWDKTHLFLVDERFLSWDDPDSNYHLLRESLLDRIEIPQENLHPVPAGNPTPQLSAEAYEEDIRRFFKLRSGQYPLFDLVLLGIGEDGHTASLFPGSPALEEGYHLAVAVIRDETRHHRITLTLPVINHGQEVVFLVSGKNKAAILKRVIRQGDLSLPASRVSPNRGKLLFLSDLEAGSSLSEGKEVMPDD